MAIITGTEAAGLVIPHLARQLLSLHAQRADVGAEVEKIVATHPLYPVLRSRPGIGLRIAAVIIAELSGKAFINSAAQASYGGLAPTIRQSGSSIESERVSHSDIRRLKRALFLSAFGVIHTDPVSRAYYDRKITQSKRHNQAIIAIAHFLPRVLFTMLFACE